MMKSVLISIQKKHNDNIFAGKKRFEGRKRIPKELPIENWKDHRLAYNAENIDTTFYIYEPKIGGGCGKVVGEFKCDFAQSFPRNNAAFDVIAEALCVSIEFAEEYFNKPIGYMLRICAPKKYDEPKKLTEFRFPDKMRHEITEIDGKRIFKDWWIEGKTITRPPQSWCYVETINRL